jgi:hypothetical protein
MGEPTYGIQYQDKGQGVPDRPTTQTIKERPFPLDGPYELIGQRISSDGSGTLQTDYFGRMRGGVFC